MKRIFSFLLVLMLLLAALPVSATPVTAEDAHQATAEYLLALGDPTAGGLGGEWMVLGLARSGFSVPESYYSSVLAYVEENIDENGRLHASRCSVNCRFIIALTAMGKDVTDVGGHDLLSGLNDLSYIQKVGISGILWTLIAFDCGNYAMPVGIDRETLVNALLALEISGGGWANSGTVADPDVTAMVLQALAPYENQNEDVALAIDRGLEILSQTQDSTGNFPSQYGSSSESISQVIVALSTLGIDADQDPRFVKEGVSALDGLLGYFVDGGGFRHIATGKPDGLATEQGFYALTAYLRFYAGKTALYDMEDLAPTGSTSSAPKAERSPFVWLYAVLAVALVLAATLFALRKKLGKYRCANALTAVAILLMASIGIGLALQLRPDQVQPLGSLYRIEPIAGNRLLLSDDPQNICTITILCPKVLSNLDKLDPAKTPYIPADGVILQETVVEFLPGQTVFDVLKQVCTAAQIPLEYSWNPLYDSYYLEGICHLYEFDCGSESGWMYQVNGTFPNYGCGAYELTNGDRITWQYSCVGQGADLQED